MRRIDLRLALYYRAKERSKTKLYLATKEEKEDNIYYSARKIARLEKVIANRDKEISSLERIIKDSDKIEKHHLGVIEDQLKEIQSLREVNYMLKLQIR